MRENERFGMSDDGGGLCSRIPLNLQGFLSSKRNEICVVMRSSYDSYHVRPPGCGGMLCGLSPG